MAVIITVLRLGSHNDEDYDRVW